MKLWNKCVCVCVNGLYLHSGFFKKDYISHVFGVRMPSTLHWSHFKQSLFCCVILFFFFEHIVVSHNLYIYFVFVFTQSYASYLRASHGFCFVSCLCCVYSDGIFRFFFQKLLFCSMCSMRWHISWRESICVTVQPSL